MGENRNQLKRINGDVINPATEEGISELVTAINSSGGTTFATNEIYEDGSDTYFCKESKDGEWYIMKIDENSVFTHATFKNNDTVTSYADARNDVTELTYGAYSEAF